jgi:hypothetical protein
LYEKKTVVDEILLAEELSNKNQLEMVGGNSGINQIMDRIETTAHASYFLDIVRTKYLLRRLIRTSTHTVERCFEEQENLAEFLQAVETEIFEIGMDKSQDASRDISQTIDAAVAMVHSFLEGKGSMRGVSTGLKEKQHDCSGCAAFDGQDQSGIEHRRFRRSSQRRRRFSDYHFQSRNGTPGSGYAVALCSIPSIHGAASGWILFGGREAVTRFVGYRVKKGAHCHR